MANFLNHARFWSKVEVRGVNECWPWTGKAYGRSRGGAIRGRVRYEGRIQYAYRVAYELAFGKTLSGVARHQCDNPACCNPYHILDGTQSQNMQDMIERGRRRYEGISSEQAQRILGLHQQGIPVREIACREGVSRSSVWNIVSGRHRSVNVPF